MLSSQLLKARLYENLLTSSPDYAEQVASGTPLTPKYYPLGVEELNSLTPFDVANQHPNSQADLTNNQARVIIDGPVGGRSPNNGTFAAPNIRFTVYAIAEADAQFLAEYLADWCQRLNRRNMPMQGQILLRANVMAVPSSSYSSKSQLFFATFTASFPLHVAV